MSGPGGRFRRVRAVAWVLACGIGAPGAAAAQLRPLSPATWEIFDAPTVVSARLGAGVLHDQRASLAGTEGRLLELGEFTVAWRSGRVALEAAGTLLRILDERSTFAPPYGGARPVEGGRRRDTGDYRISTLLLLTPPDRPAAAMLRFGTRLPTTDNRVGLERDQTDFFALVGGRVQSSLARATGEVGVGINGTRETGYEQSDVLAYALTAALRRGPVVPTLAVAGHFDGRPGRSTRGNEELAEVRIGVRTGGRLRAEAELVRGLLPFSPGYGLLLRGALDR